MVKVSVEGDRIRFDVQGWDKLWALKSQLEIPLDHVTSVRVDPEAAKGWWHGVRFPGTNVPGLLTAGTFYRAEGAVFYDVHDTDKTIVLELEHDNFARLVIEVEDPAAVVSMLEQALSARG